MEDKFRKIFRSLDSDKNLEYPQGFDRLALENKVLNFKSYLEKRLNQHFKLDDYVEDA